MIPREEIEKFVTDSCKAQGLPVKAQDSQALAQIVTILTSSE